MVIKECGVKGVLGKERRVRNVGDRTSRVEEPGTERKNQTERGKKPVTAMWCFVSFEFCLVYKGDYVIF